eukprot:CAMPEP_0172546148 /NCGR_PEP_ID=MMETSP1067-20121228/15959_1 /TAXON_ID=265564 ORGANISM="Thalassiosira punctigera, Strain Tpunct2005C2" /NCGR_SAMPLE_ID=MMETSP1067 /ASSEMBLY_ACC=CAM_ASM_000444 /LENGTH=524 /DNA_ID=CAMNT_0013333033 /DNA_START=58 /DNA_END=1632 /DNA_ORIENTATION=-
MAWEDNFMRNTASSLMDMQARMSALLEEDQNNASLSPGQGAFASFMAPPEVTSRVMSQIKSLPAASERSRSAVWYAHTIADTEREGTMLTCQVYQVTKERGSNGMPLPESDGLGMNLAMCGKLDPANTMSTRPRVLLGTIAKACLSPGTMGMPMMSEAANAFDIRPSRPIKILLQTRGEVEMLAPDLRKMGIKKVGVAEQALVRSIELHSSAMNDAQYDDNPLTNPSPSAMGRTILAQADSMSEPYVDEEPTPFGRWRPPAEPGDFPARWFARPPENVNSWRPTALLGWRTNLERAVLREDAARVREIVRARDADDVREFVECRMLLTKCAQRGLIVACELLLDECGAGVEGAQGTPDAPSWWMEVRNSSGNYGSLTPLHQAARNGMSVAVTLLLDRGADVDRVDESSVRGTALHHAVSGGQVDCCRVLCERGADHVYEGAGGDALAISELCAEGDVYRGRVQEKMQRVLREFDPRCSYCRRPNPAKNCPCRKERYCDANCQRGRWKKHKKYHKEIVGGGTDDD